MIAFMGVRMSWLMLKRKAVLAALDALAISSWALVSASLWASVMSRPRMLARGSPFSSVPKKTLTSCHSMPRSVSTEYSSLPM